MPTVTRPDAALQNAIIQTWTCSAAAGVISNMPVTLTAEKTARTSTTGENASAIALDFGATAKVAGEFFQAALLTGGAIIPVKVGTAGATAGGYARVGTTGAIDQVAGGGTTVMYFLGKFNQTGVSADVVGLVSGQFASVIA